MEIKITDEEKYALGKLAEGYTLKELAIQTKRKDSEMKAIIDKLRIKMSAVNTPHMIAIGFRNALIK